MGPSKCPYSMNTTPSSSNKMTQTQNPLIEIVWTHITDETSATKLQAELAIEGVVLWLREQGQNDAANLITKNLITQTK